MGQKGLGKCFLSGRKTKLRGDFKLQNHLLWSVSFCSNLVLISKLTHFKIVQNLLFLSYEKYVKDCHHLRLFKRFSNRTNKPHILGKGEDWFLLVINKYLHTYRHTPAGRQLSDCFERENFIDYLDLCSKRNTNQCSVNIT